MRQLIRQLEEAAPALGSKEWLSGVKKWWVQWTKNVERISEIRDKQDRKVIRSWFIDGKKFIIAMIDVLVRRANMVSGVDVGVVAASGDSYMSGKGRLEVPKVYTADGKKAKYEPGELVHPYLQSALSTLETMQDMENDRWNEAQDPRSGSMWGTTNDLDVWQAFLETLPYDIRGIDADVQAALRKFSAEVKILPGREKVITRAIPLDYDLGGVKVLTDPGSLHDLGRLSGIEAQSDPDSTRIDNITAEYVLDGLRSAQRALQQRGFDKLWYGRIFVIPPSRATSFRTKKTGTPSKSAGSYGSNSNDVILHPTTEWKARHVMEVTVHELGHRYWYKFMKAGARARFAAWFDPRSKYAQEKEGPKSDFVPAPTSYGAESPVEEFAEVFAAYVLGKYEGITLTGPQKARFEALALGRAAQSEDMRSMLARTMVND